MDKDEPKDAPIVPQDYLYGVRVIDFREARVARGLSRRPHNNCRHMTLVYDAQERRVWCEDCEKTIEAFDAFKVLIENQAAAYNKASIMLEAAKEAENRALHLIACKNIEEVWQSRRMIPTCPHCSGGLLPEDFKPIRTRISAELERQRRKNAERK